MPPVTHCQLSRPHWPCTEAWAARRARSCPLCKKAFTGWYHGVPAPVPRADGADGGAASTCGGPASEGVTGAGAAPTGGGAASEGVTGGGAAPTGGGAASEGVTGGGAAATWEKAFHELPPVPAQEVGRGRGMQGPARSARALMFGGGGGGGGGSPAVATGAGLTSARLGAPEAAAEAVALTPCMGRQSGEGEAAGAGVGPGPGTNAKRRNLFGGDESVGTERKTSKRRVTFGAPSDDMLRSHTSLYSDGDDEEEDAADEDERREALQMEAESVGPDGHHSPRHMIPSNLKNEGSKACLRRGWQPA